MAREYYGRAAAVINRISGFFQAGTHKAFTRVAAKLFIARCGVAAFHFYLLPRHAGDIGDAANLLI